MANQTTKAALSATATATETATDIDQLNAEFTSARRELERLLHEDAHAPARQRHLSGIGEADAAAQVAARQEELPALIRSARIASAEAELALEVALYAIDVSEATRDLEVLKTAKEETRQRDEAARQALLREGAASNRYSGSNDRECRRGGKIKELREELGRLTRLV